MSTTPHKSGRKTMGSASPAAAPASATTTPTKRLSHIARDDAIEPGRKSPRTPSKRSASASTSRDTAKVVTPVPSSAVALEKKNTKKMISSAAKTSNARRSLSMSDVVDATKPTVGKSFGREVEATIVAKKKLPFGGETKPIEIPPNVQRVYNIVQRHTGSIGGNGHGGAIYGELTAGSMQKMTNLMIEHTGLSKDSRFIDVGCGLGKPNLHVAQYPGVDFSYGIEMEHVRWMLGMSNLEHVLKAAVEDEAHGNEESKIGHSIYFSHGDITEANFFDPFTHVYMFDIGFPPRLFHKLAEMYNNSQSEYLICYHGPRLMIEEYGFNIELIIQTHTSMHGSAEGHTGYIYRRNNDIGHSKAKGCKTKSYDVPCDPLFVKAWEACHGGLKTLSEFTSSEVEKHWGVTKKRVTRSDMKRSSAGKEKKSE